MKKFISILIVLSHFTVLECYGMGSHDHGDFTISYSQHTSGSHFLENIYSKIAQEMIFELPIVLTGDSMIHRMNWNYAFRNVADRLYIDFCPPIVFNRGIGGNTTADLLRRFPKNILAMNPRAVFIEIGINDLKKLTENNRVSLINTIIENYKKILNMGINYDNELQIYIISILPIWGNKTKNITIMKINKELQKISTKNERIHFIDCWPWFFDSDKNTIRYEYFLGPGIGTAHLNDLGYDVWAEILLNDIIKLKQ